MLVLGDAEQGDAARGAAGDTDLADVGADELAGIGDEHDLVPVGDREGGDDGIVGRPQVDVGDALAAAAGDPVLEGRAAFAEAAGGDRENELLAGLHVAVARGVDRGLRR